MNIRFFKTKVLALAPNQVPCWFYAHIKGNVSQVWCG